VQDKGLIMKRERICAVVVTFNRKTLLEECLTALLNQTKPLDEIIVIDNASTDGTDGLMKTKFAGITYVKLGENIGGSGGFYEGIKLAYEKGHDWIWVMDDDAIPMPDALEKLTDCPLLTDDKVYALASAVIDHAGSIFLAHRRLFDPRTLEERVIAVDKYEQEYFQMDTASFVGFLISHKAINDVGLPLKDIFIYYDDTEYSLRMRENGIMLTVPSSKIIHGDPGKGPDKSPWGQPLSGWKRYYATRNRIYIYKKYGRPGTSLYINLLRVIWLNIREALLFRSSKFQNIRITLRGTMDGLRGKLGKNTRFIPNQPTSS